MSATILLSNCSRAQAASVTFAFDATVTDIVGEENAQGLLPFVPAPGQSIFGKVTFTPVPFGQSSGNDDRLEVAWEGESFTAMTYKLTTANDLPLTAGVSIDALSVRCAVLQSCASSSAVVSVRDFALDFQSSHDVFQDGVLMESIDSWNQFTGRQLSLFLTDATDTKRIDVFARVGPMRVVPEPNSVVLFAFLGSPLMIYHRPHRKKFQLELSATQRRGN